WYYFRQPDFDSIRELYEIGNTISEAAAMATETTVTRRTLGYAAPQHGNKPMAEAAFENMKLVGLPQWSDADRKFTEMVQDANGFERQELATELRPLRAPD